MTATSICKLWSSFWGNYPTGSFSVSASQVTDPAELTIESVEGFDRDGDLLDDSVEIGIGVSSSAFFETLSLSYQHSLRTPCMTPRNSQFLRATQSLRLDLYGSPPIHC